MARTATAATPCAPRLLRAALLLLLLVAACRRAAGEIGALASLGRDKGRVGAHRGTAPLTKSVVPSGAPVVTELRCQCLKTLQGIHSKNIQSVKVTSPGPHCDRTEVIATLKDGQEVCLNPEAPMVKKIIAKILKK
uniref:C-X-C motif chemokine n=1 Tax=Rhinolophus ferrumequinum TaxID=59479 RepID=A0A671FXT1_RHIFE